MPISTGEIVLERLDEERYRATCLLFADCQSVAPTAEEARNALVQAIERLLEDQGPGPRSLSPNDE